MPVVSINNVYVTSRVANIIAKMEWIPKSLSPIQKCAKLQIFISNYI